MLPTGGMHGGSGRWQVEIPEFIRRAFHVDQMELDSALSQLWQCITSPTTVARIGRARKMTKNYYHRDDPAFIVLQCAVLAVVAVACGFATGARILLIVTNVLSSVALYFLGFGAMAASGGWWYANRVMMDDRVQTHEFRREVEWQHVFDIHCNGYAAYSMYTGVAQFVLLPLLLGDGFFARLLSNALYAAAVAAYCYNLFCGFVDVPMLRKQITLLYPAVGFAGFALFLTLFTKVNLTHAVMHHWWMDLV